MSPHHRITNFVWVVDFSQVRLQPTTQKSSILYWTGPIYKEVLPLDPLGSEMLRNRGEVKSTAFGRLGKDTRKKAGYSELWASSSLGVQATLATVSRQAGKQEGMCMPLCGDPFSCKSPAGTLPSCLCYLPQNGGRPSLDAPGHRCGSLNIRISEVSSLPPCYPHPHPPFYLA